MMRVIERREVVDGHGAGSRKYLLATDGDGVGVECALIVRGETRGLCCSAQAGCAYACRHCATTYARVPFVRNLSAGEITGAVRLVIADGTRGMPLDFLDFSGVGDCAANWDAVRDASLLCRNEGLASVYRLTSIAPRAWCRRLKRELDEGLAAPDRIVISLHGADAATRRLLVPGAEDPWRASEWWSALAGAGRAVDLNYVVHQQNSQPQHAEDLARFVSAHAAWLRELRLSVMNPVPGMGLATPAHFPEFAAAVRERVPARVSINRFTSVGSAVDMACGQMRAHASADATPED